VWRFANDYDAVWWVEAEQADLIGEQFARFAVEWGVAQPGTQFGPAVKALFARLRGQGRWLVVLDNAASREAVRPWAPTGPGHVIVTSRDPHWPEIAARVEVDVFARNESVALLRAQVSTLTETDAERLAEVVGDLPLVLQGQMYGRASLTCDNASPVFPATRHFSSIWPCSTSSGSGGRVDRGNRDAHRRVPAAAQRFC